MFIDFNHTMKYKSIAFNSVLSFVTHHTWKPVSKLVVTLEFLFSMAEMSSVLDE